MAEGWWAGSALHLTCLHTTQGEPPRGRAVEKGGEGSLHSSRGWGGGMDTVLGRLPNCRQSFGRRGPSRTSAGPAGVHCAGVG